jgi:hypothetical protein
VQLGKIDEALEMVAQFESIKTGAEFAHFRYFNRYQLLWCVHYRTLFGARSNVLGIGYS